MQSSPGLDNVKIPIDSSKNLISHFESSLYADKKSYKNYGNALNTAHTSRVTVLQTRLKRERSLLCKQVFTHFL